MSLFTNITCKENIPSQFPQVDHPAPPPDKTGGSPVETNKFYTNMLLEDRTSFVYSQPYALWWTGDKGDNLNGLAISHQDESAITCGPDANTNPVDYFFMPSGVMSICLTGSFSGSPSFSTYSWGVMSVIAALSNENAQVRYPICSGMGFVTAVYTNTSPVIGSQIGFKSVSDVTTIRKGLSRFNVTLQNDAQWAVYVTIPSGANASIHQDDNQHIAIATSESDVVVQVAKLGSADWQAVVDSAAGAYPTQVTLTGGITSDYSVGQYAFEYNLGGSSTGGGTLLYAAPHHVESFTASMNGKVTNYYLRSPVMGMLRLCVATKLEMFEQLPKDIGFLPWSVAKPEGDANFAANNFSDQDKSTISDVATQETSNFSLVDAVNGDSMYFSGKIMSKFSNILLVLALVVKDQDKAKTMLQNMKDAFGTFVNNKQKTPLCYDKSWKGLVSQMGLKDAMNDFGNTYYNDHHFHYGYFVHSAALIAKVDQEIGDGSWARDDTVRDWVNSLIRDVATFGSDTTYPQSRMFDWYAGHGLAKGIFVSADGKDEESSSEDYNFFYGMKLWGQIIGDEAMEARGNLVLAIEKRSMNHYMLYSNDNKTMPANFIANKVAGITFENKVDHTTYFGQLTQYIQGIHMVPITPISSYVRSPTFVKEEWDQILSPIISDVNDGWKGILMLNLALTDPNTAYQFFASNDFQSAYLDNGMSRTWCLAFCKALL